MNNTLISIIIPTYNRVHLITQTLDSILGQTYTNWECIIVDDGSTDNTEEIVKTYCAKDTRFQFFKRPIHLPKGPNSCRNYGFEKSKGEYIKWFDSDDLLCKVAFEKIIDIPLDVFDVQISNINYINEKSEIIDKTHNYKSENLIEDYLIGKITFYTFSPTWNRNFLKEQIQLFDETISNLDDWDFNLRMLYQNPKIEYIDIPLIKYRVHDASLSHEIGKLNYVEIQSELNAREKHIKLIALNKKANPMILKVFVRDRCKYFFREALVKNDPKQFYYLKLLLNKQLLLNDYLGLIKTLFGFTFFSIFKKGYKFLK